MTNKEIISSLRGLIGKYNLTDEEWQTVEKTIKLLNNSDSDCISRKSAEICLTANITNMTIEEYISMVGDRLKALPSIQPTVKENLVVEDCISRQAVLACKQTFHDDAGYETEYVDVEDIKALSGVQPKTDFEHKAEIVISQLRADRDRLQDAIEKIKSEIKEWYWQADKQALAKDPCVVDAMVDLFIRTINKYTAESEDKE